MSVATAGALADPTIVRITTPEGVPLLFRRAGRTHRLGALLIDVVVILVVFFAVGIATSFANIGQAYLSAFFSFFSFFLFNGYFAFCELRYQGKTIGKAIFGLRVIARPAGPLTPTAVLVRNLSRLLELWAPIVMTIVALVRFVSGDGISGFAPLLWLFAVALFPFLNREGLRPGDLIAGTMVVEAPKMTLLRDLADDRPTPTHADPGARPKADVDFSREQLAYYGVYELQVLENILRSPATYDRSVLESVAKRIKAKIGWIDPPKRADRLPNERFLAAFYAAQRAHLEQQMLFGKRRADKFAK